MIKNLILFLLSSLTLLPFAKAQKKSKTILAVFAHSDDETAIGSVLAKYAKQHKVYVMYVVDVGDSSRIAG
jgi:LmbE family N-acetylglucosaminyl deacetylase